MTTVSCALFELPLARQAKRWSSGTHGAKRRARPTQRRTSRAPDPIRGTSRVMGGLLVTWEDKTSLNFNGLTGHQEFDLSRGVAYDLGPPIIAYDHGGVASASPWRHLTCTPSLAVVPWP